MTSLIACLGTGKGTWTYVNKLIESESWDNVFLITNEFGKEKFKPRKSVTFVVVNDRMPLKSLVEDIVNKLKDNISGTQVALNISSGTGKEHMAILSALLKLGLGIRLVALTQEGVVEV